MSKARISRFIKSALSTSIEKKTWTKRSTTSGKFMDQKKVPAKSKFKGVRREKHS
jgi:hypothetical protein